MAPRHSVDLRVIFRGSSHESTEEDDQCSQIVKMIAFAGVRVFDHQQPVGRDGLFTAPHTKEESVIINSLHRTIIYTTLSKLSVAEAGRRPLCG